MKRENSHYLIVGIVVLTTFALLLYVLTRLTGGVGEHDPYHVFYPNVGGLKEGTPVTYEGFIVGSVSTIVPERFIYGTRYIVNLTVRDGWSIPIDSRARIYSEGLLSETVINIEEGESTTKLVLGSELQGIQNTDLFTTINTAANDVSILLNESVKLLLENLNTTISVLGNHVDERLPVILIGIHELVQTLQSSANRLPQLLGKTSEEKIEK